MTERRAQPFEEPGRSRDLLERGKRMPAKVERPARKGNLRLKDDLHVKINEVPAAASSAVPGEGGRYVYGIVRSKGAMNFGSIGIGGAAEQVYTVNYLDIAAQLRHTGVA